MWQLTPRRGVLVAPLLAVLSLSCSARSNDTGKTQVIVSVGNLDGVKALRVVATLDGTAASADMIIDQHLEQFVIELPAERRGMLGIDLIAQDELTADACTIGEAQASGILLAGQQAIAVPIELRRGAENCTLTLAPEGPGTVRVTVLEPSEIEPAECKDPCQLTFPKRARLRLTPAPDLRSYVDEAKEGPLTCTADECTLPEIVLARSQRRVVFSEKRCSADGWCAEVLPAEVGGRLIRGVWGSGGDDIWVAGAGGTLLHWDGLRWRSRSDQVPAAFKGKDIQRLWGSGPSDIWAVGDGGMVLHWDGSEWRADFPTELPASAKNHSYISVWSTAPKGGKREVWIGGDAGALLRHDGEQWRTPALPVPIQPTTRWSGIWGSGPSDVTVVGGVAGTNFFTLRWNGADVRQRAPSPALVGVGLFGTGPDDVWAVGVGGNNFSTPTFARLIEGNWQGFTASIDERLGPAGIPMAMGFGIMTPVAVSGTRRGMVWAVGGQVDVSNGQLSTSVQNGFIVRFRDGIWRTEEIPMATGQRSNLWDVWASPSGDVVAVGNQGTVLRRAPTSLFTIEPSGVTANLRGVHGERGARGRVWVVGADRTLLRADNGPFMPQIHPASGTLERVRQTAGQAAFAVGAVGATGALFRWNGLTWSQEVLPVSVSLNSVWAIGESSALAGGSDNFLFTREAGTWTKFDVGELANLTGGLITGVCAREATGTFWVASSKSRLYLGDRSSKKLEQVCATASALNDVQCEESPGGEVWAAGDGGLLLRPTSLDGVLGCQTVEAFAQRERFTGNLKGLSVDRGDAWAVGQGGAIFHWNGNIWARYPSGTTRDLSGVWSRGSDDIWAVGDGGTILHLRDSP